MEENHKKINTNIDKKNVSKAVIELSAIGLAVALGFYTQNVYTNPALRAAAHYFGALATPGFASFATSFILSGNEYKKEKKLNKENKINEEQEKIHEKDRIDFEPKKDKKNNFKAKLYNNLPKIATYVGGIGYIAFCYGWESWQYGNSRDISSSTIFSRFIRNDDRYVWHWYS